MLVGHITFFPSRSVGDVSQCSIAIRAVLVNNTTIIYELNRRLEEAFTCF